MPHTFLAEPTSRSTQAIVPNAAAERTNGALSDDDLDADALTLPSAWAPPARPPVPVVASLVPLAGAVVLWLVTGSPMMLWFALLGPLIAGGTILDAARSGRKSRRRAEADAQAQRERVETAVAQLHERERSRLWARHPDVASYLQRDTEIWRAGARRSDALVVGSALVSSGLRVTGGERDPRSIEVRRRAAWISDAPWVVRASEGAAAVGSPMLAASVQRAWLLQLCTALPPGELRIVGALRGELGWAEELPHRRATGGISLALIGPGEQPPAEADIVLARCLPGEPLPPRCAWVVTVESPDHARLDNAGESVSLAVEAIASEQAEAIAMLLSERAAAAWGYSRNQEPLLLAEIVTAKRDASAGPLSAAIGKDAGEIAVIDLVADGPHAVVAGVTGSGKSELLITWILALCARHSTAQVNFLLADFKGGTAFDSLATVPHVTGVITDLDGTGARRALQSLRAEVRWREACIAKAGARDILDPRVELPRLVVVVDEFAALLGDHPELHAVFADVAARGRALGMHLILGTQRVSGVVRDSLLANCPLRICLRVTDAADSRVVVGVDDAATLPGGAAGRGLALIRRGADSHPRRVRIALSQASDIAAVQREEGPSPRRPWLPALPTDIRLAELTRNRESSTEFLLGLADEPERQRQWPMTVGFGDRALLIVGGAGSGRSNALELLAAQATGGVVRVSADAEQAWDCLVSLADRRIEAGTVVLIDDLDMLPSRFGAEYAHAAMEYVEELVRTAGSRGILVVATAQRVIGPVVRVAELFPRRMILALPSRADYLAAGGAAEHYAPDVPAGRGHLGGVTVQLALAPLSPRESVALRHEPWSATAPLSGYVSRRSPAAREAIAHWRRAGVRVASLDEYAANPAMTAEARVVLVGEPDEWQRHWRLLAEVRGEHDMVIDASCAAEFRLLTGCRTLPPYLSPGQGRAWLTQSGGEPTRIVLPAS